MRLLGFLRRHAFVPALALALVLTDGYFTRNNIFDTCDAVWRNDFELTRAAHPEAEWDKVFFGSSTVIAAYLEGESASGYINFGVDYGRITDLEAALQKNYVNIGDELVLGLNFLTFYDDMDTNPTYLWHKKWYEPYAYFERDRISSLLTEGVRNVLEGAPFFTNHWPQQAKAVYYGNQSEEELAATRKRFEEKFWDLPPGAFAENLAALDTLLARCAAEGVRVRAVWMPWSAKLAEPQVSKDVRAAAAAVFAAHGTEVLDLMDAVPEAYFHDFGHVEYTTGAPYFTALIDPWLCG